MSATDSHIKLSTINVSICNEKLYNICWSVSGGMQMCAVFIPLDIPYQQFHIGSTLHLTAQANVWHSLECLIKIYEYMARMCRYLQTNIYKYNECVSMATTGVYTNMYIYIYIHTYIVVNKCKYTLELCISAYLMLLTIYSSLSIKMKIAIADGRN